MSSLISQKQTRYGEAISRQAERIRATYSPAAITTAYPTQMQDTAQSVFETIDQCNEVYSPMLGAVSEAYSGIGHIDVAKEWIKGQLLIASNFVNATVKLTPLQMDSLATEILAEYPDLTMTEFVLFCSRVRCLRYGKLYGSCLSGSYVMSALSDFMRERQQDKAIRWERDEAERIKQEEEAHKGRVISYDEWKKQKEC